MAADVPPLLGHLDPGASRMVEELFRSATSRIRPRLVNRVGAELPIQYVSTDWGPVGQVLDSLSPGAAVATFRVEPSGLVGAVAIDNVLLSRFVGLVLGQPHDFAGVDQDRPPSRFDLVIARRITEDVLAGLVELLPDAVGTQAVVDQVASAARIALGLPRNTFVGATTYEVQRKGEVPGRVVVAMPSEITRLAAPRRAQRRPDPNSGLERVLPLPITVVAELRRIHLTLRELKKIQPGQVLELGPAKDVVVRVGDRPALLGEPGIQNAVRSIKVKGRVDSGFLR